MDVLNTIMGPWAQLGIVGSVVLALGTVCYLQWRHIVTRDEQHRTELKAQREAHLADVKAYGDKYAELLIENSKTQTALANAIERIGDKIR